MKFNLVADEEDDAVDFTSTLAVVLLLVFFVILLSSFLEEAEGQRVSLPVAAASQVIARDDADSVTLTDNEAIYYRDKGGEVLLDSLAELETRLSQRSDPSRPVILRCDRHCTYEQYTHLKNAVINAGVVTVFEEMGTRQQP